ncbi:hypothetical protein RhiJN_05987 [Ceratobasidium sp. AG-Ba]|nr:hypothetical protein RhiJN_05987 [Ceratobasidium sp. AG-Ba]
MVSPWVDPGNFYKFIKIYPKTDRMELCLQIANGLAYLHENQVIFGDLKAQNILIGFDGIPKLTDFGSSVLNNSEVIFSETTNPGGGTTRWMAPELLRGDTGRSYSADLYALGMVSYEVFTETVPFPEIREDMQVMYAVVFKHRVPVQPRRLRIRSLRHKRWWSFLKQSWARQTDVRPLAHQWSELDDSITIYRAQQLILLLERALQSGDTIEGLLRNLDTNEILPTMEPRVSFFVPWSPGRQRKNSGVVVWASLQKLIEFHANMVAPRQYIPDSKYIQDIQDRIYESLDQRIEHVRYWIDVNVAHFSPKHQSIRDLHGQFAVDSKAMRSAVLAMTAEQITCALLDVTFLRYIVNSFIVDSPLATTADTCTSASEDHRYEPGYEISKLDREQAALARWVKEIRNAPEHTIDVHAGLVSHEPEPNQKAISMEMPSQDLYRVYQAKKFSLDEGRGAARVNMEGDVSLWAEDRPWRIRSAVARKGGRVPSLPESSSAEYNSQPEEQLVEDQKPNLLAGDQAMRFLLAGGIAGAVSRTVTAPLDRLKVYLIVRQPGAIENMTHPTTSLGTWGLTRYSASTIPGGSRVLGRAITNLYAQGGLSVFRAGNGLNIGKIFPESIVKFSSYESSKRFFARYVDEVEDIRDISVASRFISGGIGGITSSFVIYPVETLKTQIMSTTEGRQSVLSAMKRLWALGRLPAYYRGLTVY